VVELGHGVAYPSPDGLSYIGQGGARVATAGLFRRDDWQALAPSTMVAGEYEGAYVASYEPGGGRRTLMLDPVQPRGAFFADIAFTACFRDPLLDTLFILSGTSVQQWDNGAAMTAVFESKTFRTPTQTNYGFLLVIADSYPVTVDVWADGVLRVAARVVDSRAPVRLPPGYRADHWRVRISTANPVQAVLLANSSRQLQHGPP
jgi:hypothetical protein